MENKFKSKNSLCLQWRYPIWTENYIFFAHYVKWKYIKIINVVFDRILGGLPFCLLCNSTYIIKKLVLSQIFVFQEKIQSFVHELNFRGEVREGKGSEVNSENPLTLQFNSVHDLKL